MKTYTVDMLHLAGINQPGTIAITKGIDVSDNRIKGKFQVNLGEYGNGSVWAWVPLAFRDTPSIVNGKILDAYPIMAEQDSYFLAQPRHHDFQIMVRVNTKSERCLGLRVSAIGDHDKIVAEGSGVYGPKRERYNDMLIVVEPHSAIMVSQGDVEVLAIVNNAGNLEVVSASEYAEFFLPHYTASAKTTASKADELVVV